MAAPGMIEIPLVEYRALIDAQTMLDVLHTFGVENWEGWDDAIELYTTADENTTLLQMIIPH